MTIFNNKMFTVLSRTITISIVSFNKIKISKINHAINLAYVKFYWITKNILNYLKL